MKILLKDLKKGMIKLKIDTLDDLWYLSYIIDKGDRISGHTLRKIKVSKDENSDVVKKKVFLKIEVEKYEFSKYSNILRAGGKIIQCPDDVSMGSHHTFNIEKGVIFNLHKSAWLKFQLDKLEEAHSLQTVKVLICIFDREESIFAILNPSGYEILTTLKGNVQKKDMKTQYSNFYSEIYKTIVEYDKKNNYNNIIIASPSFFKEYLLKEINDEKIKKKIVTASISSVSSSAINEVIKRGELASVLSKQRSANEIRIVESFLENISKDKLCAYGFKEVQNASNIQAIKELLVTDKLIHKKRMDESFYKLETIMRNVENSKGHVHLISSENEAGKKLDSLGSIGAILRFQIY